MGQELYIGLMSGTSMDGIDAVMVDLHTPIPHLLASYHHSFNKELSDLLHTLTMPGDNEIQLLGKADVYLGQQFAEAVKALLKKSGTPAQAIKAIGCHGQTIRHCPSGDFPFTLQIGDPNTIASATGITTIADFRRKDMAFGGQGAPLTPAFHDSVFRHPDNNRVILNIGGIANITLLSKFPYDEVTGYDTGPGNTLLDTWIREHKLYQFDDKGEWAKQGSINENLLQTMLADPYFTRPAPKSTGREHFNLNWLRQQITKTNETLVPKDVQCTLIELTAISIIDSIKQHFEQAEVLLCGGGVHNNYLVSRLEHHGPQHKWLSTAEFGIPADWLEAIAFAWMAQRTIHREPSSLPSVTGAQRAAVLGGIYAC